MDNRKTAGSQTTPDSVLTRRLFKSILITVFSLFCMTYSAWAMFTDSVDRTTHTLSAASFHISIAYPEQNSNSNIQLGNNCVFEAGEYDITLTASGTAKERSGYAKIVLGDPNSENCVEWFTGQLKPGDKVTFELVITGSGSAHVAVSTTWGTLADTSEKNILKANMTVTYPTPNS